MQLLHLYDRNRITLPPCLEDSRKHCTNIFKSFLAQKAQPQNKKNISVHYVVNVSSN